MKITGIHHVQICIPREKIDEARDFYKGILQLEEIPKPEALRKNGGMWFEFAHQQLHIGVEDQVYKGKHHPAFLVDDLLSFKEHLALHHIQIQEELPIPGFSRFTIRDPFGNRIEFIQPSSL
ncbi:VOC family protein [Fictibacillus sp. 18YEL24]|uniref:VOC family protein n=1 Tax=Fictibacillus sp. 18YEL24 TaxID=2745875 RepID=UPI0018CD04FF|nr:VOC family protein [Fictibacillus sp. 18YEL24]MBH0170601.1 VOC family protein [Fictibacillus sp. 18YEL24]